MTPLKTRILLADDHELVRDGLRMVDPGGGHDRNPGPVLRYITLSAAAPGTVSAFRFGSLRLSATDPWHLPH
jgi:hypothetical protein